MIFPARRSSVTRADIIGQDVFERTVLPLFRQAMWGETASASFWFEFAGPDRRYSDVKYNPYLDAGGDVAGIVMPLLNGEELAERVRESMDD